MIMSCVLDPTWTNSSCRSCWNFFGSVVMDTGPISAKLETYMIKDLKQRLSVNKVRSNQINKRCSGSFCQTVSILPRKDLRSYSSGLFLKLNKRRSTSEQRIYLFPSQPFSLVNKDKASAASEFSLSHSLIYQDQSDALQLSVRHEYQSHTHTHWAAQEVGAQTETQRSAFALHKSPQSGQRLNNKTIMFCSWSQHFLQQQQLSRHDGSEPVRAWR